MKKFVDPVPPYLIPKNNFFIGNACRGLKHDHICKEDFVPSWVPEYAKRNAFFNSKSQQGIKSVSFSLSLFVTPEAFEENLRTCPIEFSNKFIGYGIGPTSPDFGIASSPNTKGHIDYYLFDYVGNNPYSSFTYKVRQ
jgi:hypothetical protein